MLRTPGRKRAPRLLLWGRAVITPEPAGVSVLPDHAILVEGARIAAVGPRAEMFEAYRDVPRRGDAGAILIPGLVNAHSHGMGVTNVELGTLDQPLELWNVLHLGRGKPPRGPETALCAVRQLEGGITTTVHCQSGGGPADADEIARGYRASGIRCVIALHARNQNRIAYEADRVFMERLPRKLAAPLRAAFPPVPRDGARAYQQAFDALRSRHECDRLALAFGPAGVQWVDPAFLKMLASRARFEERVLHTHLLESPYERAYGPRCLGASTVPWLEREGILGPHFVGAHAIWLSGVDLDVLARAGACLVHCPSSNLRLSSGRMPLLAAWRAGVSVALGLDSQSHNDDEDLFCEMRLALRLGNNPGIEGRRARAADVFRMATIEGARSIGHSSDLGRIHEGYLADVALIAGDAIDPRRALRGGDLLEALLARARPEHVRMTMVAGEILVERGRHLRLRKEELARKAHKIEAGREDLLAIREDLLREVAAFYKGWKLPERRRRG